MTFIADICSSGFEVQDIDLVVWPRLALCFFADLDPSHFGGWFPWLH